MYKFWHRFWVPYWRIVARETLSPVFDRGRFFSLFSIPAFLLLCYVADRDVREEIQTASITGLALLVTIPIWFGINLLLSLFRVFNEERQKGEWVGTRFIYHSPKHVKTVLITPNQDGQAVRFRVNDAPARSFVQFKTEYDGGLGFLGVTVHENQELFSGCTRQTQYGVRLNDKKEAILKIKCSANSADGIARVSMLFWEK